MLWIAFKFYYLRDEEQLMNRFHWIVNGCELLSNFIIFGMKNNVDDKGAKSDLVVNCFQILLSSGWRTTISWCCQTRPQLWIAFKFYYLRDEEQLLSKILINFECCELLSNFIIFGMKNNLQRFQFCSGVVVNCFQILLSSGWRTTKWGWY